MLSVGFKDLEKKVRASQEKVGRKEKKQEQPALTSIEDNENVSE